MQYKKIYKIFKLLYNIYILFNNNFNIDKLKDIYKILFNVKDATLYNIWKNIDNEINLLISNNLIENDITYYKTYQKEEYIKDNEITINIFNIYWYFINLLDKLIKNNINLSNLLLIDNFINYFHCLLYYIHKILSYQTLNINYFINILVDRINKLFYEDFIILENKKIYDDIIIIKNYQISNRYLLRCYNEKIKFKFQNLINSFDLRNNL